MFSKTSGKLKSLSIPKDPRTDKGRGFAFVEMNSMLEAQEAISDLSGESINGRKLSMSLVEPKKEERKWYQRRWLFFQSCSKREGLFHKISPRQSNKRREELLPIINLVQAVQRIEVQRMEVQGYRRVNRNNEIETKQTNSTDAAGYTDQIWASKHSSKRHRR